MKHSIPNAVYALVAYPFLLLLTLFVAALIWAHWVSGSLYRTDSAFSIFDIIPPFVYPGTDDVYLVPVWRVWFIWWSLMAAAFVLPALAIWYIWRRERNYDA